MKPDPSPKIKRRQFLQAGGAAVVTAVVSGPALAQDGLDKPASRQSGLIRKENERLGARDWQLTRVFVDRKSTVRSPRIEGYCSHQSIRAGETLDIMVSVDPSTRFIIEIFRTGYYGGRGARLMTTLGPLNGQPQPNPSVDEKRLRECVWDPSASVRIPGDWPSGVYLGRLTTMPEQRDQPYWQSYVIFIVRDDRAADVLFQCSDNTWQAYNRWPDSYSLYTDPRGGHALDVAVSFDRPYGMYPQIYENPQSVGSGEFLCFEFPLSYWLEQHGYDVTYCSNSDCLDRSQLTRCKTFISVGHDEYWDLRQFEAAQAAIAGGVNVLWLCGNSVFGVTPFSASRTGRPNRVLTRAGIYGGLTDDEIERAINVFTKEWKRVGADESLIIGARSIVPFNGGGDWSVTKPGHWIFAGTGMKQGESIPGLVGWEHHGAPANLPGLEVVAGGVVWSGGVNPARWTATIYPGQKKNFVFNAATIFWAQGLSSPPGHLLPWSHWSRPHGPDERVQRITHNLLRRAQL